MKPERDLLTDFANTDAAVRRLPRLAAFAVAVCAGVALLALLRYPSLYEPHWYGDEGIFAAIAHDVRSGDVLYRDAWDNKPPFIFYTYAAVQAIFGTGIFPLHLGALIVAAGTQLCVAAVAFRAGGTLAAAVTSLAFGLLAGGPWLEGNLALTESFIILPSAAAVAVIATARETHGRRGITSAAGAGLLLGVAANYKQVAVFDLAAVAVFLYVAWPRPGRALLSLAGGFALVHVLFGAYVVVTGTLGDYWYAVAGSLGRYSDMAPQPDVLTRVAGLAPATLAVVYASECRRTSRVDARVLALLWLGFASAGALSGPFSFPHYALQAAAPWALVLGLESSSAIRRSGPRDTLLSVLPAVTLILVTALGVERFGGDVADRPQLQPRHYYDNFVSLRRGEIDGLEYKRGFDGKVEAVDDITAAIRADGGGDTAFAWSELPWLYSRGNLENPARYFASFIVEYSPGARDEILRDLARRPPTYIVISEAAYSPFPALERFVAERYTLIRAQGDWELYRRAEPDERANRTP
jgi:hypothetical protein